MSELLSTTSRGAMVVAGPKPAPVDTNFVGLDIAYDAFNISDLDSSELEWRPDATIGDYLDGLPAECEWLIYVNGTEVTLEDNAKDLLCPQDRILLILVPQGGNTMKSILRIGLMAVSIAVAFIPGMQWWAAAGIAIASGLVSTFLLTPKPPKAGKEDDKTYGIDGPKNSATEGIVYPVGYGEFRIAGNLADCYTVNVGDDQYLYMRAVLNDGEIDSISDIELNEQPIANFENVQTRFHNGTLEEQVNDWFTASIVQIQKGVKLDTGWTTHTTTGDVDRVRFDVAFTEGLTNLNMKKGTKGPFSVELECQYREVGTTTWNQLPIGTGSSANAGTGSTGGFGGLLGGVVEVAAHVSAKQAAQAPVDVKAINTADGTIHTLGTIAPTDDELAGYVFDPSNDGTLAGTTDATPMVTRTFSTELPAGTYDIDSGAAEVTRATSYGTTASGNVNATGKITFTDHRAITIRRSIESGTLPRGTYEVRIRRTVAEDTGEDKLDTVYLSDVAEIDNTPVALRGTANLSLKIKLNEQLNQIPQMTTKAKLSLCRRYDNTGAVIDQVWTTNPAWQALDALLSPERGALISTSRIDWPRWVEYAQWCEDNNIQFNGTFAEGSNIGDAVRQILRVGQATLVPFGTKFSVAVDRAREPVHVFTQGNILKDTFQINYLSMADRSNEYEFTYYDKTDRNKAKTIRYVDPKAVQFAETPRAAQVSLVGVDNVDQAKREMWKAIYQNRLILRTISFDSWLDSMNMTMGEVALIQHDMMEWAENGRVKAAGTPSKVILDQDVTVESGKTYSLLVHHSALLRGTTTVNSVVGSTLLVNKPSGADFTADQLASKRLIVGDEDYEIASITNGTTYHTIKLTEAPTGIAVGATIELWDTDVLEERSVAGVGDITRTNLLLQANNLTDAAWVKNNGATVVRNVGQGFGGMDSFTVGDATATFNTFLLQAGTTIPVGTTTLSGYIKKDPAATACVMLRYPGDIRLIVNPVTGQSSSFRPASQGITIDNVSVTDTGTGFWRATITVSLTNAFTGNTTVYPAASDLSATPSVSLAPTSTGTAIVCGLQIESGAAATAFIPTTTTAVTVYEGAKDVVNLATPLSAAPAEFANFVFGLVNSVRKPYVLTGISGNGLEKRKLTFVEYNEGVYAEPEIDIPIPVTPLSGRIVQQVRALTFNYDPVIEADRRTVPVTLKWKSGHITDYAGADIFTSINGGALQGAGSAMNTSETQVNVKPGDVVRVVVVAFNSRGDRAPAVSAPAIGGTVNVQFATIDPPTNVLVNDVHFEVDGKVAVSFDQPLDMTGVRNFEVQYKRTIDATWTSVGYYGEGPVEIPGLPTGNYTARVRSAAPTATSVWVTKAFTVAVAPGSLMENWNNRNDRNGDPIPAPTLPATGVTDHTLNSDGSANVSFEWLWGGDEATIDGFQVDIDDAPPA